MEAGVIALLVGLGSAALTPVAVAAGKFVSQAISLQTLKLGNSNFEATKTAVQTAVFATDQLYKSGQIKKEDRKERAMKITAGLLKAKKVKYDDESISAIIEAAVYSPDLEDKQPLTPVVMPPVTQPSPPASPPPLNPQAVSPQDNAPTIDEPFPHSGAVG